MSDLGFETEEDIYVYTRKGFEEALAKSVVYAEERLASLDADDEQTAYAMSEVMKEAAIASYTSMYTELKQKINNLVSEDKSTIRLYERLRAVRNQEAGLNYSGITQNKKYEQ